MRLMGCVIGFWTLVLMVLEGGGWEAWGGGRGVGGS